ncbi:MAG: hypothetical protein AB7E24_11935 [Novosphingobium sp.]
MTLPAHIAGLDEPISAPWGDVSDGPDLRKVATVEVMLRHLSTLGDDEAYVAQWQAYMREIGASLTLRVDRTGNPFVMVGFPCDSQTRHRNRWFHFLNEDFKAVKGRRDILMRNLR